MKMIFLAIKMIWKQKLSVLLFIITSTLSISYLCPILSQTIHYITSVQTLKRLDMENAYYLYSNPYYSKRDTNLRNSVEEKISKDYITGKAEILYLPENTESYQVMAYNNLLIDKFMPKISIGTWLDNATETTFIPAVVAQTTNYKYGDIFSLLIVLGDRTIELRCEVVGLLDSSSKVLGLSGAADNTYFTTDALISSNKIPIILPVTETIEKFIKGDEYRYYSNGSIIYTTSTTDYDKVLQDFGYAGIVTNLGEGNNRFYEQSKVVAAAMGTYFCVYLLITVVCLICNNLILSIHMQRTYTIYYLTGMPSFDRLVIEGIRTCLLIFISAVPSFLYLYKRGILFIYFENYHPLLVFMIITLYLSLIFVPVSISFIKRDKNVSIIDSIHRLNTQI